MISGFVNPDNRMFPLRHNLNPLIAFEERTASPYERRECVRGCLA